MDMSRRLGEAQAASAETTDRIRAELGRAEARENATTPHTLAAVLLGEPGWSDAARAQGGSFHAGQAGANSSTDMTGPFTLGRKPSFNGGG